MKKILVFDMDGTIADFYGVEGWLEYLENESTVPYTEAAPMYDMDEFCETLHKLQTLGYMVVVTTWLSKHATAAYKKAIREAKKEWLDKYNFPYDEFHGVQYGATKADSTRKHGGYQILFDDNEKIRNGWNLGEVVDANEDILKVLKELLKNND